MARFLGLSTDSDNLNTKCNLEAHLNKNKTFIEKTIFALVLADRGVVLNLSGKAKYESSRDSDRCG